ncbi:MAG: Ig-like domain-containing protein, partial [Enterovibrio sp.]
MKTVQIDGLSGLKIAGFTITVKLPNGEVQTIENGVTALLKGELSLVDSSGKPISTADVLANVNLNAGASIIVPELISSEQKISEAEKEIQLQMAKAEHEQLQKQLEELKKLKEELDKKQKELEEKNKEDEKNEEELKQQKEQNEQLQKLIDDLNTSLAEEAAKDLMGQQAALKQMQALQQELADESSSGGKKGKYDEPPSFNNKSGSSSAPPQPIEEKEDKKPLAVEVKLSSSSDSGEKDDFITKFTKPIFEIKTAVGATITLIIDGVEYEAVADSSGKAIIQTTEKLADGEYNVTVKAVDSAGNDSSVVKQLVIDTTPPEAEFKLESDSGIDADDGLTNVNKPIFTGKVSGDPVELYIKIGSKTYQLEAKNGEFSFTLPTKIADGKYEVSLVAVDAAGNETIVKQTITIDTENSFEVSLQGASDSGVEGDWLTNIAKPSFVFEHEPGSKIEIVINGVVYNVPSQPDSFTTLFQLPVDLSEGINTVKFICVDAAGNRSVVEQQIVIDTKAPSFDFKGLSTDSNSGLTNDNITSNKQPVFQGRAEAGSTVYLVIDNITYSAVAGSNGHWSITISNTLADGDYEISAWSEDLAGNRSAIVTSSVVIDTVGPVISGGLDDKSDSGESVNDNITNAKDLIFSGKTEPNCEVTFQIDSLSIVLKTVADEFGNFSFTVTGVPSGVFSYVITAVDAAGNQSAKPVFGTVDVDREVVDFSAMLDEGPVVGPESFDNITNDNTPTVKGSGEVGSKVTFTVVDNSGKVVGNFGPIVVDEQGEWSFTLPTSLSDGAYDFEFKNTDLAGNSATQKINVIIDTHISLTASLDSRSDSGDSDSDQITNVSRPQFSGTADADSKITITLKNAKTGEEIVLKTVADSSGDWSVGVSIADAITSQGIWNWSVSAVDVAGNIAKPVNGQFLFDSVAPSVDVELTSKLGFDPNFTNDNTLDLTIRTEPNAKIVVTVYRMENGVLSPAPVYSSVPPVSSGSSGQLNYRVPELSDGQYVYQVSVTDIAGNTYQTQEMSINIDTNPPSIGIVSLSEVSDSNIAGDNITNQKQLVFNGEGTEVGAKVYVTVLNKSTGETVSLANNFFVVEGDKWSFAIPKELADGQYRITFMAQDKAGNFSPGYEVNVTIDTTPPVLGSVTLDVNSDSGVSQDDFITNKKEPTFIGSAKLGDVITIEIYRGNTLVSTASTTVSNADGRWQIQIPNLADGTYRWAVTAKDIAGNETKLEGADQKLTIDTVYQGGSAQLDSGSNSGSTSDNITKEQNITLSGKGETGSTVALKSLIGPSGTAIDITSAASVVIDSSGSWSLHVPTLSAGDGQYTWVVELSDVAGNSISLSGNVVLDTGTHINAALESDNGLFDNDGITNDKSPTFSGTGEVGGTVRLLITDSSGQQIKPVQSVIVGNDGTWRLTLPAELKDGNYTWRAEIQDIAGNTQSTLEQSLVIDSTVPVVLNCSLDTTSAFISDPPELNASELSFSGKVSEARGIVVVHIYAVNNGVVSGTPLMSSVKVTADEFGNFKLVLSQVIPEGEYRWAIEASDVAGNKSLSEQHAIIIDRTPPAIQDAMLDAESDTSLVPGENYSSDTTPSFSGKSDPSVRVIIEIFDKYGQKVAIEPEFVVADKNGDWKFVLSSELADGDYTWVASALDAAGNKSSVPAQALHIDTMAPVLVGVSIDKSSDTGTSDTDSITNDNTVTFKGVAEKGNLIELKIFSADDPNTPAFTFSVTVSAADGSFSIDTSALPDGTYYWQMVATDAAGNLSDAVKSVVPLIVDTSIAEFSAGLDAGSDSGDSATDTITNQNAVQLSGKGEIGATVTLNSLTNSTTGESISIGSLTVVVGEDGNWQLQLPELSVDGVYNWSVTISDIAGNSQTLTGSFTLDTNIDFTGGLDSSSDSGDNSDSITNIAEPKFSGIGTDGDKITVQLTGPDGYLQTLTTTVQNGVWEVKFADLAKLISDGTYSWVITATDVAGNS